MLNIKFVDEISTQKNAYKITYEDGSTIDVYLNRNSNVTTVGTPLNADRMNAIVTAINNKVEIDPDKQLSTNDYTNTDKTKVNNLIYTSDGKLSSNLIPSEYVSGNDNFKEFLNNEWEKQLNIFNVYGTKVANGVEVSNLGVNGGFTITRTGGQWSKLDYQFGYIGEGDFTISYDQAIQGYLYIAAGPNSSNTRQIYGDGGINQLHNVVTFQLLSTDKFVQISFYCNADSTVNTISNIILNSGDTELDYQPYNGLIVHKKDVEDIYLDAKYTTIKKGAEKTPISIILSDGIYIVKCSYLNYLVNILLPVYNSFGTAMASPISSSNDDMCYISVYYKEGTLNALFNKSLGSLVYYAKVVEITKINY